MSSSQSMPPYFSWIEDRCVAVCARPFHHSQLQYLRSQGIQRWIDIDTDALGANGDVLQQIEEFIRILFIARERGEAVLVQSQQGFGMIDVYLACYFAIQWSCSAEMAIDTLVQMRPAASFNHPFERQIVDDFLQNRCHC